TSTDPELANDYLESISSAPLSQKVKAKSVLTRPGVGIQELRKSVPELDNFLKQYDDEIISIAETHIKYEGYIEKEKEMVDKMERLENVKLREDLDYHKLVALSAEAREKLSKKKPGTIGQASRISGVSPSDISILLVHVGR
ncbi:MAG TPA: tRNA uridine-5-carboxymethylaminomethyl(34) synthesis enzyme MnmG, partial [Saprospiraceae bacterium]|nr:tRNA uridine-5-carboxymethylaminomethyl(34) synthesis enzyme MnmG [Saprospiraceae bacterium]